MTLDPKRLVFLQTASQLGRVLAVSPANSDFEQLHYARLRLDETLPELSFETDARETGLICLGGEAEITTRGETIALGRYDGVYLPRGSSVVVRTRSHVDLIECSAVVEGDYPLQVVRYADIQHDPSLCFRAGGPGTTRDLCIVLGKNVKAGRIVAGFTRSAPGNWTSWPPHEHRDLLEEIYVYYDMPAPAFGIQLVYTKPDEPELVQIVREGDAVLMPAGYHPNVSIPGHPISFVWMMAAHREVTDRLFGVVNVQPEFNQSGSGLEASRR